MDNPFPPITKPCLFSWLNIGKFIPWSSPDHIVPPGVGTRTGSMEHWMKRKTLRRDSCRRLDLWGICWLGWSVVLRVGTGWGNDGKGLD